MSWWSPSFFYCRSEKKSLAVNNLVTEGIGASQAVVQALLIFRDSMAFDRRFLILGITSITRKGEYFYLLINHVAAEMEFTVKALNWLCMIAPICQNIRKKKLPPQIRGFSGFAYETVSQRRRHVTVTVCFHDKIQRHHHRHHIETLSNTSNWQWETERNVKFLIEWSNHDWEISTRYPITLWSIVVTTRSTWIAEDVTRAWSFLESSPLLLLHIPFECIRHRRS